MKDSEMSYHNMLADFHSVLSVFERALHAQPSQAAVMATKKSNLGTTVEITEPRLVDVLQLDPRRGLRRAVSAQRLPQSSHGLIVLQEVLRHEAVLLQRFNRHFVENKNFLKKNEELNQRQGDCLLE